MYFVKENLVPREGSYSEKDLSLTIEELGLSEYFGKGCVSIDFEMRRVQSEILCTGKARTVMNLTCGRCLEPFEKIVECDFLVDFKKQENAVETNEAPGPGIALYDADLLPLGEEIRQELECHVSFTEHCSKNCLGLCFNCGVNLNAKPALWVGTTARAQHTETVKTTAFTMPAKNAMP